jgi:hypothetical protein
MEFQLEDITNFPDRLVIMIGDLWHNSKIILHYYEFDFVNQSEIYKSEELPVEILLRKYISWGHYCFTIKFLHIEFSSYCRHFDNLNKVLNDSIRLLYSKYKTINGLKYPVYQMLECSLACDYWYSQSTPIIWKEIEIKSEDNMFILTCNGESFTDEYDHPWQDYIEGLMRDMRNNTAPEIFYTGLPIKRMKSARNNFLIPLIPRNE